MGPYRKFQLVLFALGLGIVLFASSASAQVTGLVRVQEDSSFDTVATKEVQAQCPAGKQVVGGGYLFFFSGPTVPIRTNAPALDLGSWFVSGTNLDGTSGA